MASGLTGDFRGLERLIGRVENVIAGGLQAKAAQELAAQSRKLIADEFREERDPYGVPWAPLKHRKGRILRDTGYMAGHVGTYPTGRGFRVTFLAGYARIHQNGAVIAEHRRAAREMRRSLRTGKFAKGTRTKKGRARQGSFTVLPRVQGAYKIPRRALLPSAGWGGLGPIWTRAFNKTLNRVVRAELGKRTAVEG